MKSANIVLEKSVKLALKNSLEFVELINIKQDKITMLRFTVSKKSL